MGGAVGMAIRKKGAASRVIGVADRPETIEQAKALGAVHDATLDLAAAVQEADLIILAVPVRLIPEIADLVVQNVKEATLITDLGSTKAGVVGEVERIIRSHESPVSFIGSHPITGSEKTGIESAKEVNLEGATCVLTPTPMTDHEVYKTLEDFWKELGMKTMRLAPEEHDAILGRSSHLPHLVSYALINAQTNKSLDLSGPGLRDMTRLAGSDVSLWSDILTQNAFEMSKIVRAFADEMDMLANEVEILSKQNNEGSEPARERLFRYLADAKQRHNKHFEPDKKDSNKKLRTLDTQIFPKE